MSQSYNETQEHIRTHNSQTNMSFVSTMCDILDKFCNTQPYEGFSIRYPIACDDLDNFYKRMSEGVDVNEVDSLGRSPLHYCVIYNRVEMFHALVMRGATTKTIDKFGRTPLHDSVVFRRVQMVKELLKRGSGVNVADNRGQTPIHYAMGIDNVDILCSLLDNGADVQSKDMYGITPLEQLKVYDASQQYWYILEKYRSILVLRGFCRIVVSKAIANKLRALPDNLFHEEYSTTRKRILGIDDSKFI